jgi:hypothetical protein
MDVCIDGRECGFRVAHHGVEVGVFVYFIVGGGVELVIVFCIEDVDFIWTNANNGPWSGVSEESD